MKKSAATKAQKTDNRELRDLAPANEQVVRGGAVTFSDFHFVQRPNAPSPK